MTAKERASAKSWSEIFGNADVQKRALFTLGALAAYRLAEMIPLPGLSAGFSRPLFHAAGSLDFASSGVVERHSILMLGIFPYVNACAIMSLAQGAHMFPYLDRLEREGAAGRRTFWRLAKVLTFLLATVQACGLAFVLSKAPGPDRFLLAANPSAFFYVSSVLSLIAGTFFIIWLAEQISERGIGNGIPLIILAGIAVRAPVLIRALCSRVAKTELSALAAIVLVGVVVAVIYAVVAIEKSPRQIPIQYSAKKGFLSLRMDQNWIPAVIWAASATAIPFAVLQFFPAEPWARAVLESWQRGNWGYELVYAGLIVFFCHLFTMATFNSEDLSRKITKAGGAAADGSGPLARRMESIQGQITLGGALFAAAVIVLSDCARRLFHASLIVEGTSLFSLGAIGLDALQRLRAGGGSFGFGRSIVFTSSNSAEAGLVQDFLTAHDIAAVAFDENICRINPFLTIAVGGIKIHVPENQAKAAAELLQGRLGVQPFGRLSPFNIRSSAN